jgi:hypothetical protein
MRLDLAHGALCPFLGGSCIKIFPEQYLISNIDTNSMLKF